MTWKSIKKTTAADYQIFKVIKHTHEHLTQNRQFDFVQLDTPDYVNVIPLTTQNEVVMVRQYRVGIEDVTLEFPGGVVDLEDQDPSVTALRELKEETGYTAQNIVSLGDYLPNPAIMGNRCHAFLALGCEKTDTTDFDENEETITELLSLKELESKVKSGEINHALMLATFLKYTLYRNQK